MSKKKKKPAKRFKIDWQAVLVGALADFIVGFALLLIGKLIG